MAKDLRSYLDELLEKRPKDVVVVDKEVDPCYEASAIVEKFERKNEFPLVFFKNIKGSKIPLVINLGATYERLALSLGSPSVPQMVKDLAYREHHPSTGERNPGQRRAVQRSDFERRRCRSRSFAGPHPQ